jgi:hypothetical protein
MPKFGHRRPSLRDITFLASLLVKTFTILPPTIDLVNGLKFRTKPSAFAVGWSFEVLLFHRG